MSHDGAIQLTLLKGEREVCRQTNVYMSYLHPELADQPDDIPRGGVILAVPGDGVFMYKMYHAIEVCYQQYKVMVFSCTMLQRCASSHNIMQVQYCTYTATPLQHCAPKHLHIMVQQHTSIVAWYNNTPLSRGTPKHLHYLVHQNTFITW